MSNTDPISDMLTRIRNGQMAKKLTVLMPSSRIKCAIAQVLKEEGYIEGLNEKTENGKPVLEIGLKYYAGKPVIADIRRVSSPGLRRYNGKNELPSVAGGYGIAVVSTSKGIMTDRAARSAGVGGEILCEII